MNAPQKGCKTAVVGALLALAVCTVTLWALPGNAYAQTTTPPPRLAPLRLTPAPLRATPVTPALSCVYLTTDGAPGSSFVGGQIKERCFAFPGEAGATVSIVLKPAAGGAIPAMELRGPDGKAVARSKDGQIAGQLLQATGPYALIVSGASLSKALRVEASVVATGGTGLGLPSLPGSGASQEPATLCSGVIEVGQSLTGMVPFPGETCRFTFVAKRGESVSAWMESLTDSLQPEITLLDPAGNVLDTGHGVNERTRYAGALNLPVSGAYTVLAGGVGGESAGAFKLKLESTQSTRCGEALALGMLTEVQLPSGGDRCDLFFDVPYSRWIRVNVFPLDGAAAPSWSAIGPQGTVAASSEDEIATWYAEETGPYTLSISPAGRRPERVLIQVAPPATVLYHGSFTCGGALNYNTFTATQPQVLMTPGGSCRFTFRGAAGDVIWVTVPRVADESNFEPVAELMAPRFAVGDAPEAVSGDSGTADLALIRQHTLAKTGLYTIRISDYGNDDAGSFYVGLWKQ